MTDTGLLINLDRQFIELVINQEFLNLGTIEILDCIIIIIIFVWGRGHCSLHCKMFSGISDLYPLDIIITHLCQCL